MLGIHRAWQCYCGTSGGGAVFEEVWVVERRVTTGQTLEKDGDRVLPVLSECKMPSWYHGILHGILEVKTSPLCAGAPFCVAQLISCDDHVEDSSSTCLVVAKMVDTEAL